MRRLFAAVILILTATSVFAGNYNSISLQGQLTSSAPIYGVTVDIMSGGSDGQIVTTGSPVDLVPDTSCVTNCVFSTQTYLANPRAFLAGLDYAMCLRKDSVLISSFPITGVPFALTVRGDLQNGDQNVFGAYGNVGIGTTNPAYKLMVSSASGTLFWAANDGIHVDKAHQYSIDDSTVLVKLNGNYSYGVAIASANAVNVGDYNLFVGALAGYTNSSGNSNSFVGVGAGTYNSTGVYNSFFGMAAGYNTFGGDENTFIGYGSGNVSLGSRNTFLGSKAGNHNKTGSDNIFIGLGAGDVNGSDTAGNGNIIIGNHIGAPTPTTDNYLNIGGLIVGDMHRSSVTISNDLYVLGNLYTKSFNGGTQVSTSDLEGIYSSTKTWTARQDFKSITISSSLAMPGNAFSVGGSTFVVAAGNVGVGTNTPTSKLHVFGGGIYNEGSGAGIITLGNISASSITASGSYYGNGATLSNIPTLVGGNTFTGANVFTGDVTVSNLTIATETIGNLYVSTSIAVTGNSFSVGVSTFVVMAGNVGIGTISPTSKLQVSNGAILNDGTGAGVTTTGSIIAATGTVVAKAYYGNGSTLSSIPLLDSTQTFTGTNTFLGSVTVNSLAISAAAGNGTVPPGAVIAFYLSVCPTGWHLCDGTNSTPDLRGRFVRGMDTSGTVDPTVRTLGSIEGDALQNITGTLIQQGNRAGLSGSTGVFTSGTLNTNYAVNSAQASNVPSVITFNASTVARTSTETRPVNVSLIYCLKQ